MCYERRLAMGYIKEFFSSWYFFGVCLGGLCIYAYGEYYLDSSEKLEGIWTVHSSCIVPIYNSQELEAQALKLSKKLRNPVKAEKNCVIFHAGDIRVDYSLLNNSEVYALRATKEKTNSDVNEYEYKLNGSTLEKKGFSKNRIELNFLYVPFKEYEMTQKSVVGNGINITTLRKVVNVPFWSKRALLDN